MSRTGGHFDFLACGVRVFLERDERTRGLEKTADGFFRLSIFFKTLPSFQNFGGKKILLQKRQVTRKQTKRNMTRTTTRKANGGGDTVKYSIIVPTYNEQLNIAMLLALIVEAMEEGTKRKEGRKISPSSSTPSYEVIVVDDNSQDQTQQTIQKLQKIEID